MAWCGAVAIDLDQLDGMRSGPGLPGWMVTLFHGVKASSPRPSEFDNAQHGRRRPVE